MSSIWDVPCLTNHMHSARMFKGMCAPVWCVITDWRCVHWIALWLISLSTWAPWKSDAISVCPFPSLIKQEKEQKQREHKEKRDKGTKQRKNLKKKKTVWPNGCEFSNGSRRRWKGSDHYMINHLHCLPERKCAESSVWTKALTHMHMHKAKLPY